MNLVWNSVLSVFILFGTESVSGGGPPLPGSGPPQRSRGHLHRPTVEVSERRDQEVHGRGRGGGEQREQFRQRRHREYQGEMKRFAQDEDKMLLKIEIEGYSVNDS